MWLGVFIIVATDLDMALAANKAVGDVLRIIGRSPIVLEEVFDAILTNALQLCDAELAVLHLYEKKSGFRFVRAKNVPAEFEKWLTAAGSYKANPDTGLGRIERSKKPVNIVDIRSEDIYEEGDPLRVATADLGGARSFVAFPMLAGDELKGVFSIYRQTVRPFNEAQVTLVGQFADQAVIALENARLLKETRELSDSLAKINENLEAKVQTQVIELEKHSRLTRFLPDKIAEVVMASGDDTILRSHRRMIATIFCDLRRFTRFSESADPEEVMQILEAFHAETSKLTADCSGTIIQRAGDGVMIVLNDPITIDEPARRAVELAAKLRAALAALSENWQKYEYDLSFGIGLSYGYATLGVVGSEKHQNYTAIGPAINIASRLCDAASDGQVLVTQRVCTEVGDSFAFEPIGQMDFKGVSRKMNVFSLK